MKKFQNTSKKLLYVALGCVGAGLVGGCRPDAAVLSSPQSADLKLAQVNGPTGGGSSPVIVDYSQSNSADDGTSTPTPAPSSGPKISPAIQEVARLLQAGVGEEAMLQYVRNSPNDYRPTVDEVLYLNDLGVTTTVLAELLRGSDESFAQKMVEMRKSLGEEEGDPGEEKVTVSNGDSSAPNAVPNISISVNNHNNEGYSQAGAPPVNSSQSMEGNEAGLASQSATPSNLAPSYSNNSGYASPTTVSSSSYTVAAPAGPPPQAVEAVPQPPTVINQNYIYQTLSPYGTWVEDPDYGWCWQPTVAVSNVGWQPYGDRGRWLYTDYGWYWQSYYSWGHLPFHYGRWNLSSYGGWIWVPGTVWAPAWVTWRHSHNHIGWAPLPPYSDFHVGIGFTFRGSNVSSSFSFGLGFSHFTFIDHGHFYHHHPYHHYHHSDRRRDIYNNSTVINNYIVGDNNTIVNGGISREEIASRSRQEIRKVSVREVSPSEVARVAPDRLEGGGKTLTVYRPSLPKPQSEPPSNAPRVSRTEIRKPAASSTASSGAGVTGRSFAGGSPSALGSDSNSSRLESPKRAEGGSGSGGAVPRPTAGNSRSVANAPSTGSSRTVQPTRSAEAGSSPAASSRSTVSSRPEPSPSQNVASRRADSRTYSSPSSASSAPSRAPAPSRSELANPSRSTSPVATPNLNRLNPATRSGATPPSAGVYNRAAPSASTPAPNQPTVIRSSRSNRYETPATPSYRSSPAPATRTYSAPSAQPYTAPSTRTYSAPAPSRTYTPPAPSRSYSPPASVPSAPSRSYAVPSVSRSSSYSRPSAPSPAPLTQSRSVSPSSRTYSAPSSSGSSSVPSGSSRVSRSERSYSR